MTSPYDFYQFWRNVDDQDVQRLLGLFTMLPLKEVRRIGSLDGHLVNRAKEILAYEVTALNHGHDEAAAAYLASTATFGNADPEGRVTTSSRLTEVRPSIQVENPTPDVPGTELEMSVLASGLAVPDLFILSGLAQSKGEARRLIRQGGAYVNDERVDQEDRLFGVEDLLDGSFLLRAGKKRYHRLSFS
jgi:tyrosyl-tRNA synthetase